MKYTEMQHGKWYYIVNPYKWLIHFDQISKRNVHTFGYIDEYNKYNTSPTINCYVSDMKIIREPNEEEIELIEKLTGEKILKKFTYEIY